MYNVITIGTATRDAFLESGAFVVKKDRSFPAGQALAMPAGAKIEVEKIVFTTGGGATNAAVTFARQGFKTACIAKVGEDVSGEEVRRGLSREGVATRFVSGTKKYPTGYSILILSPSGERTILVYRGASEHLEPRGVRWKNVSARWFYIFPGKALKVMEAALARAKEIGARVALNPSGPMLARGTAYFRRLAPLVDVLIMNREEGSRITGIPYGKPERIFKKFDEWMPCLAVLTDGKNGVMVSDGTTLYRAGAYREKKLIDRTGAGDAFGSGFVAGLLLNAIRYTLNATRRNGGAVCDLYPREVIEYAMRLGSANATSVVEYVGAKEGILTRREFMRPRWKRLPIVARRLL